MDPIHAALLQYQTRASRLRPVSGEPNEPPATLAAVPEEGPMKIGSYAKAIVAAFTAGAGALFQAVGDNVITPGEWVTITLAVLASLGIVAAVPNAKQSDQPQR